MTLELGGKSAQVVFPDADLDAAANGVIAGVFAATGQTCMAGSRVIVHADVKDALVERVVNRAGTIKIGNPLEPDTEMGPMATDKQYDTVLSHFESARAEGATIACGGNPVDGLGGWFVEPTVLVDTTAQMRAVREEIFGPVVAVTTFATEDEAIALANGTEFGLAGRSGRRTCTARTGWPPTCAPGRSGSTPTASSPRMFRSAGSAPAASGARTASTRSASTPRPRPSGWN